MLELIRAADVTVPDCPHTYPAGVGVANAGVQLEVDVTIAELIAVAAAHGSPARELKRRNDVRIMDFSKTKAPTAEVHS